jgi:hypothetical protein
MFHRMVKMLFGLSVNMLNFLLGGELSFLLRCARDY